MNIKRFTVLFFMLLCFTGQANANQVEETDHIVSEAADQTVLATEQQQYLEWAKNIWEGLERQTGSIELPEAAARLDVPEQFYFLNAKDADTVLVEVWGNPPGQPVLGMLFPAHLTPFDENSWAVTIEYEEDGYVSDADAADIDYSELLTQMQEDTRAESEERLAAGYEAIALVGWAAPPFYDKNAHKLHWAKELKFGEESGNTLNYNIRVLGRKGVLVLNFIAGMDQKPVIEESLDSVLALANFTEGNEYADFNPDTDKIAAYGIGALVAGKLMTKAGVFATLLIFLKKYGVFIVVGIAALVGKLVRRKK